MGFWPPIQRQPTNLLVDERRIPVSFEFASPLSNTILGDGLMPWVNSQLETRQPDEIRYIYQMSTRCQLGWFHVSSLHYRRRTRLSGALAKDAKTGNTLNGVVLKFMEPPEARVPSTKWRLYVFKNGETTNTLHIHRKSVFWIGRDKKFN